MPFSRIPSCTVCCHEAKGLFCGLVGEHLEAIDRAKVVHHYDRGRSVFVQGDPSDALYCVYSGTVELYKVGPRDREVVIRLLRPGDVMGYRAMLANEPLAASARAVEDTTICAIHRFTLFEVMKRSPELVVRLLSKLARELRVSEDEMVARVSQSVSERVARFMLWLMAGLGKSPQQRFDINAPIRREDMAHAIGVAPETLSRVLHDFERREIVRLDGHLIRIRDPERLRTLATGNTETFEDHVR